MKRQSFWLTLLLPILFFGVSELVGGAALGKAGARAGTRGASKVAIMTAKSALKVAGLSGEAITKVMKTIQSDALKVAQKTGMTSNKALSNLTQTATSNVQRFKAGFDATKFVKTSSTSSEAMIKASNKKALVGRGSPAPMAPSVRVQPKKFTNLAPRPKPPSAGATPGVAPRPGSIKPVKIKSSVGKSATTAKLGPAKPVKGPEELGLGKLPPRKTAGISKSASAGKATAKPATNDALEIKKQRKVLADKKSTPAQKEAAANKINKIEGTPQGGAEHYLKNNPISEIEKFSASSGRGFRKAVHRNIRGGAKTVASTMIMSVLFMIPAMFESAFLAERHRTAMLKMYAAPIDFGNIVLQMPDSVFNMIDPLSSQFIYYGIPVEKSGAKMSPEAVVQYPGVTGPSQGNKISKGITKGSGLSNLFSGNVGPNAKNSAPQRYNLKAAALSKLPLFVSYTDDGWSSWGANAIPDAAFSQKMINLNTGYAFYADGTSSGMPPAELVGVGSGAKTVSNYLATAYGKLKTSNASVSYTEYSDSFSGSKGHNVSSSLEGQFACGCLNENDGVLSAETLEACGIDSCLLVSTLNKLSAGLIINADGQEMTHDQDLAEEVKKGALGQVVPIQGLGEDFGKILSLFPGADKDAVVNYGVLTMSLGFGSGATLSGSTPMVLNGAEPDNYAAKGVYVYQCKNTPLAKMLKSQSGGSATTAYNDQIVDYIVFLDTDLNSVPMMVPTQDPDHYNFITMSLNPDIEYVSTIIGDTDAQGNFTLLPQLNIQSPKDLMAKGLPASFAPLYGLKAQGGSLAVNYNTNITSKIDRIAQELEFNNKLGQQFKDMKSAMLRLLSQGPFGKYQLVPVKESMQPNIGGVNLVLYTGYNGYPVSQDATGASDVLIPMSDQGKTITLPSTNVSKYYGLVTDLTYTVNDDGSMTVDSDGHENSPFSQTQDPETKNVVWSIDSSTADDFYWITQLTNMGVRNDPEFQMPESLLDFVQQSREEWIGWITTTNAGKLSNQEFAGTPWAGTDNSLKIVGQQALANELYVYVVEPNRSNLAQDFFVLTNNSSPAMADPMLGTMSAESATTSTNMLSIISGILYNSKGMPVKNVAGVSYGVDAQKLIQNLHKANPKGFSDEFKKNVNLAFSQANSAQSSLVYPFAFGELKLGIYQSDLDKGSYVYCDAAGAGTSASFMPKDFFVTYNPDLKSGTWSEKLSPTTPFMMSLVTGIVYAPTGPQYMLPSSDLKSVVGSFSASWRPELKDKIRNAAAQFAEVQSDEAEEDKKIDGQDAGLEGEMTWTSADVVKIITSIAPLDYLPAPYDLFKFDPISNKYVLLSPANAEGTEFMYTFLNVPNTYTDASGKKIRLGAMYDGQGNLMRVISGVELSSTLRQYGIGFDANGSQALGIPNMYPVMYLDPSDHTLQPGATGKSMIHADNQSFPSNGIQSPVMYEDSKFYFYYNTIMKAYFVMEVNDSQARYISLAGGDIYNTDGSCIIMSNPLAIRTTADVLDENDIMLPYLNDDSYTEFMMKNSGDQNQFSDFVNVDSEFVSNVNYSATNTIGALNSLVANGEPYNSVNVLQMPAPAQIPPMPDITVAKQYNVYWDQNNPVEYKVHDNYDWSNLELVPVNMKTRSLMDVLPASIYDQMQIVMKDDIISKCLFIGKMYTAQLTGNDAYTLKQVDSPLEPTLKLSVKTDSLTGVLYIEIIAGIDTYNYQYSFETLLEDQVEAYQYMVWKAQVIADVSGRVLLVKNLPNISQLSSVSSSIVKNLPASNSLNIGSLLYDSMNDRYLAKVEAGDGEIGYVDLETAGVFDEQGIVAGYILPAEDALALLNELSISVMRDNENDSVLVYRSSTVDVVSKSNTQAPVQRTQSKPSILGRLSSMIFG